MIEKFKQNIKITIKKLNNYVKYIERFFKLITYPIIGWVFNTQKFEGKINPESIKRVLFIRHDYVGDMIVTLPTFSYLKAINPNIEIDVFCSKNNFFILNDDNNINNVIVKKEGVVSIIFQLLSLRKNKYNVVFNTQYMHITKNGFYTCLAADKKSIKTMVGSHKKHEIFFNKLSIKAEEKDSIWLKMLYLVEDLLDTSKINKIIPEDFEPYIAINEKSQKAANDFFENVNLNNNNNEKIISINLSARQPQNMWSKESYLEITNMILNELNDFKILLFSVGVDKIKSDYITQNIDIKHSNRVFVYPQTKDIKEVAAALSKTNFVITPDTGFIHLASAVKVPIVGLYGGFGTNTQHWRPYKVPFIQIEAGEKDNVGELKPELIFYGLKKIINNINSNLQELINQRNFYKN